MSSFSDYVEKKSSQLPIISEEVDIKLSKTVDDIPSLRDRKNVKQEFKSQVKNYLTSDEFLNELDQKIGDVRENESEEEFVERGKEAIRRILYRKFDID